MGPWSEQELSSSSSRSSRSSGGQFNARGLLAGAGAGISAATNTPDNINTDFKQRNQRLFSSDTNRKKLENIGFQSGNVYGMAAAAVSAAGRQVDKAAKDEFGLYKNKAGEFFDNSFDWGNGIEFWKDTFNGKVDAEGVANQLTLGLVGTSTRQRQLQKAKRRFEFDQTASAAQRNKEIGAQVANEIGRYEAPAYGRNGMKVRTKFNNY